MILNQKELTKQIANKEDIDVATVRKVFNSAENIIFAYLSSTTPSESKKVKLLDGLSLECNYIPQKTLNRYEKIDCDSKIWVTPKITRHYNRKLNGYFDK